MLKIRTTVPALVLFWTCFSCAPDADERITNDIGKYSITKLANWEYKIKNRSTMLSQARVFDSLEITAAIIIAPGNADVPLDETFEYVKDELSRTLKDFHKINEGYTEINGHPTRWLKLSHTLYDYKYISLRYYMQLSEKTPVMLDCSSIDGTFEAFEEDFTKMVFSLRTEN